VVPLDTQRRVTVSGAPGPVVSERQPAAEAAAKRSGVASWAVGVAMVITVAVVVALRFGAAAPSPPPPALAAEAAPERTTVAPAPRPPDPPAAAPASPGEPRDVQPASTVVPKPAPPASAEAAEIDRAVARAALSKAAGAAAGCKQADDPTGSAKVSVTFAPTGRPMSVRVGQPFKGTRMGVCIAATFYTVTVPPFSGDPVTITKDMTVR
jgi:hypothetical protein